MPNRNWILFLRVLFYFIFDSVQGFNSSAVCMQVWALAVGKKTEMLATGGTDATINIWHDCTAADKEEAFHKEVSLLKWTYKPCW